jgi:antitoxin HicB
MASHSRPLSWFLGLNYTIQITEQDDGGCFARIVELPGCTAQGESLGETLDRLREARESWLRRAHAAGREIPMPESKRTYSGKFIVRVPRSIHAHLAEAARREGVSLNQYIVSVLSRDLP